MNESYETWRRIWLGTEREWVRWLAWREMQAAERDEQPEWMQPALIVLEESDDERVGS